MRYVLVFAIGLLAGWLGHAAISTPKAPPRADPPARAASTMPPAPEPEPASLPPAPPTLPAPEGVVREEGEAVPADAPDAEMDRLREMILSQSKAWKGWAGMQARQKAEALLASLPFDAEREKRIQELLQQEAELQAERAAMMMLGEEEMDPDAFHWFLGLPPELSPGLERELATFLNDGEIQVVRAEVKRAHEKQMRDVADMQIGMMQIRDLSDDQRTRMREVFSGKDMMTERFLQFAEVTRDRDRMRRLLKGEGLKEEMEKNLAPTRRRVRDILTHEQFAKYQAYEKQLVLQAEMGIKMMSSFLGQQREEKKEPASR